MKLLSMSYRRSTTMDCAAVDLPMDTRSHRSVVRGRIRSCAAVMP